MFFGDVYANQTKIGYGTAIVIWIFWKAKRNGDTNEKKEREKSDRKKKVKSRKKVGNMYLGLYIFKMWLEGKAKER